MKSGNKINKDEQENLFTRKGKGYSQCSPFGVHGNERREPDARGLPVAEAETWATLPSLCAAFAGDRRTGGEGPEWRGGQMCGGHPRRGIHAVEPTLLFYIALFLNCWHRRPIRAQHVMLHTDALARWAPAAVGGTLRRHRRRAGQLHPGRESRKTILDVETQKIIRLSSGWNRFIVIHTRMYVRSVPF